MKQFLLETSGALLTMQRNDASYLLPRLREFMDCDAVSFEKCTQINGDHSWVVFTMHRKWCDLARAFIKGWEAGGRDSLDRHCGRVAR